MLAAIDLPPQCRSLQRTSTKVEGERDQRIKLPVRQRHRDEPQNGSLSDSHVLGQKLGGLSLRNVRCELLSRSCANTTCP